MMAEDQDATDRLDTLTLETVSQVYARLGELADRFIQAWEEQGQPELADYLPAAGPVRRLALVELIKIDLEFNWLGEGSPRYIDDYRTAFPELDEGGIPSDLLYEEFHLRREAGLQVEPDEYLQRFPENAEQLRRLMNLDAPTATTAAFPAQKKDALNRIQPGDTFDDFQLLNLLGKGSFASVFLARQISMQRLVALKISVQASAEPQTLGQFDNEYIVRVYDQRFLPEQDLHLLYMQYVPGGSLDEVLKHLRENPQENRSGSDLLSAIDHSLERRGESRSADSPLRKQIATMTWPQAVGWLSTRLARALEYAHQRGVIHRDVKPANVLLTPDGVPKLADFNVSFCSKLEGASAAAFFGGSLAYMSPEQLQACNPANAREPDSLDGRSDAYSLAVLTWELLTGTRPFAEPSFDGNWTDALNRLEQSRYDMADKLTEANYGAGLQRVLSKALSPDRDDRWATCESFAQQLELCADARSEQYLLPGPDSWRFRVRPVLFWLILAATVLPSVLAALLNFSYNYQKIISQMSESAEQYFMFVQTVTNAVAFPLGLAVMAWLVRSTAVGWNGAQKKVATVNELLNFGHYSAWICVILWTLAGLTYPLSMQLGGFDMPIAISGHFFFSLLLCGLLAVSLNFFGVTALTLRVAVPWCLNQQLSVKGLLPKLHSLGRSCWLYLLMSAAVPMLTTTAMVTGNQEGISSYLIITSLGGAAAFVAVLFLFRSILHDVETLSRISRIVDPDHVDEQ